MRETRVLANAATQNVSCDKALYSRWIRFRQIAVRMGVNLVHGALERLGEPLPAEVVAGAWWAGGSAVSGSVRLANGARWDSAWIQLLDVWEYREAVSFLFEDSVRRLTFPSPWLKQSPIWQWRLNPMRFIPLMVKFWKTWRRPPPSPFPCTSATL